MTDRTRDDELDRQIRQFLAWQAEELGDAPSATEMAMRIGSRTRTRTLGSRSAPLPGWALLAGLLFLALLGAAVIGALSQRHDPRPLAYEAVLLRRDETGGSTDVLVVGVGADGRERQIARLPGTRFNLWSSYGLHPMGAVSPSGLLAIPMGRDDGLMHWEIFDLHHPQAAPIAVDGIQQDFEQIQPTPYFTLDARPSVFWGPGERVAIPWYDRTADGNTWHLSFVDGRSGAATSVDVPDGLRLLPRWASDGSGVLVDDQNGLRWQRVLRPDGSVVDGAAAIAFDSCRTIYLSGAEINVAEGRIVRHHPDGRREELPTPGRVGFACLAPDDSAIAHSIETSDGNGGITPSRKTGLIIGSRAPIEVEGSFAGWLAMDP